MADTPDVQADETAESSVPAEATEEPTETIAFRLADDTATNDGNSEDANVPSFRLREERERRTEAERRLEAANAQVQTLLINQARQTNNAVTEDDLDPEMVSKFGTVEEGADTAYRAVRDVSRAEVQAMEDRLYRRIMQESGQIIDQKVGSVSATMTSAQQLAQMKSDGLLDDAAEQEMGRRMSAKITENQAWGLAENQQNLIDTVYMDMLRSGQIKPQTVPPVNPGTPSDGGNSPLQPGTTNGAPERSQDDIDAELREIQRKNPKVLGNLSIERLRELDPGSSTVAPASPQPVRYVHTR